jgi:hypothetical protein
LFHQPTNLCAVHVVPAPLCDLHDNVWRVDDGLLKHGRLNLTLNGKIKLVDDRSVAEVVLAVEGEAKVGRSHDAVVVLNDNFVGVDAHGLSLDVALEVVVGHLDAELDRVLDVDDAAVGVVLCVHLSVEDLVGADGGDHVSRAAVDRHVVAGRELVSTHDVLDDEKRLLKAKVNCHRNMIYYPQVPNKATSDTELRTKGGVLFSALGNYFRCLKGKRRIANQICLLSKKKHLTRFGTGQKKSLPRVAKYVVCLLYDQYQ